MSVRIISGGQAGVDRAALDVAMELQIPVGGWVPRGRRAEDGRIPDRYPLTEMATRDYAARTAKNVEESDATLVLYRGKLTPGSALTTRVCIERHRRFRAIDLGVPRALHLTTKWLDDHRAAKWPAELVLNIAGSRESSAPGIYEEASAFLRALLAAGMKA